MDSSGAGNSGSHQTTGGAWIRREESRRVWKTSRVTRYLRSAASCSLSRLGVAKEPHSEGGDQPQLQPRPTATPERGVTRTAMSWHLNHVLRSFLVGLLVVVGTTGQSTVLVYLPGYRDSDWRVLRGSILSSVSASRSCSRTWAHSVPCDNAGPIRDGLHRLLCRCSASVSTCRGATACIHRGTLDARVSRLRVW